MKLDEAIKEIQVELDEHPLSRELTYYKAIRLGIEALKFRQRWEDQEGEDDFPRLPGETEK